MGEVGGESGWWWGKGYEAAFLHYNVLHIKVYSLQYPRS